MLPQARFLRRDVSSTRRSIHAARSCTNTSRNLSYMFMIFCSLPSSLGHNSLLHRYQHPPVPKRRLFLSPLRQRSVILYTQLHSAVLFLQPVHMLQRFAFRDSVAFCLHPHSTQRQLHLSQLLPLHPKSLFQPLPHSFLLICRFLKLLHIVSQLIQRLIRLADGLIRFTPSFIPVAYLTMNTLQLHLKV